MLAARSGWRLAAVLASVFALLVGNSDEAESKDFDVSSLLAPPNAANNRGILLGQQALDEWRQKFEARSLDDWGRLWNVEKHRR